MSSETHQETTLEFDEEQSFDGLRLSRNLCLGAGALLTCISFDALENADTKLGYGLALLATGGIFEVVDRIKNAQ